MSEVVAKGNHSCAQGIVDRVAEWSQCNRFQLNSDKSKEMQISFAKTKHAFDPLLIDGKELEVVSSVKLLGLTISDNLCWKEHISEITKKAAKRIYFLLQLKRAGVSKDDLLTFYKSCIRSVLDYAVPVLHTSLPRYLMSDLERIQKRVLSIIIPGESYYKALENVNLVPLEKHHDDICSSLSEAILKDESHRLRKLLPPVVTQNYNLRKARNFNVITKTKRTKKEFYKFSRIVIICINFRILDF